MCPEDGNCGDGFCCAGGCRSIAEQDPKHIFATPQCIKD